MGAVLRVEDKYTGEVVQELPLDDRETLRARIEEAWKWRNHVRRLSLEERRDLIRRVGEAVAGQKTAFEELLISQAGQPRKFAAWEVERTVMQGRAFGALLELVASREIPARAGRNLLVREPYGVVGVITPRNTPLVVPFYTLFSCLGAGNACVQKPSNLTPGPTVLLVELARKAGWPPGAIQYSTCPGEEAAAEFVENPRVQAFIAYSSSPVGKHNLIKMGRHLERTSALAEYGLPVIGGSMTKYVPELAGNDPFVVLEGADLDLAVTAVVQGGFANAGQLCISAKRLLVHRPVADEFKEALIAALGRLKVGDPRDPETDIGPLGRRTTLEIALRHVARARDQGGVVLCGGRAEEPFFYPTLIEFPKERILGRRDEDQPTLWVEESFAPVRSLVVFDTVEEAVWLANDGHYALGAALFGPEEVALAMAREIDAGRIIINESPLYGDIYLPVGGVRDSGLYGATDKITEVTYVKRIHIG